MINQPIWIMIRLMVTNQIDDLRKKEREERYFILKNDLINDQIISQAGD